jgi:hypothetical protein
MKPSFALPTLLPLLLLVACSSEQSSSSAPKPPCNEDPWQCPAGQTCWPKDTAGSFACLNSAAGKARGDECSNTVGAPTCGDGLACFQGVGDATGRCVAYCDNAKVGRGCAAGETCTPAMLTGSSSQFQICIGASAPKDAGTPPSEAGAGEAGSDAAAGDAAAD